MKKFPEAVLGAVIAEKRWLNRDELALVLGISASQVDRLREKPEFMKFVHETRATGKPSFDRAEIDQWMEAGKVNPVAPF